MPTQTAAESPTLADAIRDAGEEITRQVRQITEALRFATVGEQARMLVSLHALSRTLKGKRLPKMTLKV